MYQLSLTRDFIAQHYLIGGDWGAENLRHSHHYRIELTIAGDTLDRHGYLIDIVDVDRALSEVTVEFRDTTLNEHAAFAGLNPSIERFAHLLWDKLTQKLALTGHTLSVKLWENATDWAAYGAGP